MSVLIDNARQAYFAAVQKRIQCESQVPICQQALTDAQTAVTNAQAAEDLAKAAIWEALLAPDPVPVVATGTP